MLKDVDWIATMKLSIQLEPSISATPVEFHCLCTWLLSGLKQLGPCRCFPLRNHPRIISFGPQHPSMIAMVEVLPVLHGDLRELPRNSLDNSGVGSIKNWPDD